jgi:7-cyano-7-deazaguanine reductase
MAKYTRAHARAGLKVRLPKLEVLPNHYKDYQIKISIPEYTSLCPKTGLPDAGTITIEYEPDQHFVELKSLKLYILAYRNLGIFYENAVNRILRDFTKAVEPVWAVVRGEFNPRGGISSVIEAKYHKRIKAKN